MIVSSLPSVISIQVNDLQMTLGRAEQQSGRKEEALRQEISDLQMRLQEAEARNQELSQSVTAGEILGSNPVHIVIS